MTAGLARDAALRAGLPEEDCERFLDGMTSRLESGDCTGTAELARAAARRAGLPEDLCPDIAAALFAEIEMRLAAGEEVRIDGFGTWSLRRWPARELVVPVAGAVQAGDGWYPSWKAARRLRQRLRWPRR